MYLRMKCAVLLCYVVVVAAEYDDKLTKLWSMSGASQSDGSAVVNVTSASIVIQPSYENTRSSKDMKGDFKKYIFKPRAIPLRRSDQTQERNVYYAKDNGYKSEILFPGNYFTIAKQKSENLTETYNPLSGGPFKPKTIPLMRGQDFQRRSLDLDEEPSIEETEGLSEQVASKRSYFSDVLGEDDDDDDREYESDEDVEIPKDGDMLSKHKNKVKKPKLKAKKYSKYMMPLLMAYKLKYFALVPAMIAGLVLLVGATGMAGFFFALFAAVMGLQKGGY